MGQTMAPLSEIREMLKGLMRLPTHMPTPYRPISTALCLAALVLAAGCNSAGKASSPDVWAVVDKTEIRRDEVEKAYRRVAPPPPAPAPSEDEALTAKLGIVDELITREALNG